LSQLLCNGRIDPKTVSLFLAENMAIKIRLWLLKFCQVNFIAGFLDAIQKIFRIAAHRFVDLTINHAGHGCARRTSWGWDKGVPPHMA